MIKIKALLVPVAILVFSVSCSQKPSEEVLTPKEANQKLIKLCKEEYNLDIVTKAFNQTLWIYLPLNQSYLSLTASKNGPEKSSKLEEKLGIKFIDGSFADNTFHLRYDIGNIESYTDSKGIGTKVSQEYSAKQRFLFSAISRAYGDVEKKSSSDRYVEKVPGDVTFRGSEINASHKKLVHSYVKTDEAPDFFVIVIADIKKGIETRMYVYLGDLLRGSHDPGFGEEYVKRVIVDQPIGHEVIIGDKSGSHLNAYDLTWPEFLMKQMIYRTILKYTFSSFPPSQDTKQQLIDIAAETIMAYNFNQFESVNFRNLRNDTTHSMSKGQLQNVEIRPPKLPGKIHRIKFEIGPPKDDAIVE